MTDAVTIDTADVVLHGPTNEQWVVAAVSGDRLYWCGWPYGSASLADCTLIKKASPWSRLALLKELAATRMSDGYRDPRVTLAKERLDPHPVGTHVSGPTNSTRFTNCHGLAVSRIGDPCPQCGKVTG